jgi:hypothetical protein
MDFGRAELVGVSQVSNPEKQLPFMQNFLATILVWEAKTAPSDDHVGLYRLSPNVLKANPAYRCACGNYANNLQALQNPMDNLRSGTYALLTSEVAARRFGKIKIRLTTSPARDC